MKNLKQLTAIAMCTLFATMQVSFASIDTGLGVGNGGAVINNATGGFVGVETGTNSATLNFNGNSHVNWNTLNVNSNETLNFNAVNGTSGLSVINTVNSGMSNIYGQINSNAGISKLIISNPNGVLFDGATFTTAGDTMITTKNMAGMDPNNITDGTWTKLVDTATNDLVNIKIINNSDFSIGGEFNIIAPKIVGENSSISAGNGLKLTTVNGADYTSNGLGLADTKGVTFLKAMNINGDVVITNDVGALSISDGTVINGDLKATTGGYIHAFGAAADDRINIKGDADLTSHSAQLILRNANVDGDLSMNNDGGFVEINNVNVGNNASLTTTGWQDIDHTHYDHFVHVNGNTDIGGDFDINSSQNIHIGNYEVTNTPSATIPYWEGNLLDGNLKVGGNLTAKTTGGHITTTINTTAKNIDFTAQSYNDGTKIRGGNILSDGKAVLTADTYKFKSDGYIGALKASDGHTVDDKIINVMEEYQFIPDDTASHEYMNINGGTISKIETPKTSAAGNDVQVYIKSNNDLLVSGANAGAVNLVAPDKKITITGDVHAKEINVGGRTGTLQLDYEGRDFTTHYTNIKDGVVKTIKPTDKITYELTNEPTNGYNSPDFKQTDGTNTTYLVGPYDGKGRGDPIPSSDDNVRVRNVVPDDPTKPMAGTPIAYAADLDEDEDVPCRKNVDGSVTVVRAYPMVD